MKEKKNIDRLYQEKFKDFEAVPREAVWKSISAKLKKEERKKPVILPLWRRLAGVAAVLSILLLIGEWLWQPLSTQVVTNEEQVEKESEKEILMPAMEAVAETGNRETEKPVEPATIESKKELPVEPQERPKVSTTSAISTIHIRRSSLELPRPDLLAVAEEKSNLLFQEESFQKSIYDELNKKLEEEGKDEKRNKIAINRMEITTQAAPIYYGNFGKGNFLDTRFNNKNSEGEVTYSYGINVAYAISDKLKIRSGVNKVSMSYNTNDVTLNAVANSLAISNIDYSIPSSSVQVSGTPGGKNTGQPTGSANRAAYGRIESGFLNQKTGFIEVPVELEYNLLNSKINVNIIGGVSTLFLDENMVSLNTRNINTVIGEASNLNALSFSTNIGFGFDYNLSKKFKLNVEPIFKYQIKTYDEPAGNFQPYYLGIYSGFSFRF